MRTCIVVLCFCAAATVALAGSVKVFIAPRSSTLPPNEKMPFDVYWMNYGERPSAIPAAGCYSFSYVARVNGGGFAAVEAQISSNPPADRQIAPGATIRDHITVKFDPHGAQLLEVTAEFKGRRATFNSNTIMLATSRR
jgi:hypothetical protein